ncbi:hypothetical protein NDU88_005231 [Pleurodeles waltl]|uniref:Uncharacterized protein n=1 Tax=Pleurodeles waltl TaxID=8319 RepID=A0AAV7RLI3_PLEWA|nr:hypothetical protein NDU88_005231 [Pleurodeles waltl]
MSTGGAGTQEVDKLVLTASLEDTGSDIRADSGDVAQFSPPRRPLETREEISAGQDLQPSGEDHGHSIADMLKALSVLQDLARHWYEVRRTTRLSYYSEYALVLDSPGSPEWTKDALATPLKEAGLLQWVHLCYNGEVREIENLNMEVRGRLSKCKYLQIKSWARNVTEEVGSTNSVVGQIQLDTPLKKEVARWYWLIMDIVDGEFTLLEEVWRE